ncbi:hypothetical protein ACFWRZ_07790 [Streptomyces rubiginosohelvolus]
MQYTQDALFPDADVVGTGRPLPWHSDDNTATEADVRPFQVESLPVEDAA